MTGRFNEHELSEFREAFSLFSKGGQNTIAASELTIVMRSLGETPTDAELDHLLRTCRKDAAAPAVEFAEFVGMMALRDRGRLSGMDVVDLFLSACRKLDPAWTDELPVATLRLAMVSVVPELTDGELGDMVELAVVDDSGRVNYRDWCAGL